MNVEHVVALCELGLRARLLYIPSSNEAKAFECAAPVEVMTSETQIRKEDVVVVPEPWAKVLKYFSSRSCRKVLHCQNPFYIFHSFSYIQSIEAFGYHDVLSCSRYTTEMLRRFGFRHPIHTVRPAISPEFHRPAKAKSLQIAYMPRKRNNEAVFMQGLFKSLYPQYRNIPWVAIQNVSRATAAEVMQNSLVFAAFGFTEGLGLPPLEAMACGCVVVGFDGLGGADYSRPDNGFWVDEGDYFGFAHQLAKAIEASQTPQWREEVLGNCAEVLLNYSQNRFNTGLVKAWKCILQASYNDYLVGTP